MSETVYVHFDKIKRVNEASVIFRIDGEDVCLPKSQIQYDVDDKVVIVPSWLARDRCLEDIYERQLRLPFRK